jgi:hypothetical protein
MMLRRHGRSRSDIGHHGRLLPTAICGLLKNASLTLACSLLYVLKRLHDVIGH